MELRDVGKSSCRREMNIGRTIVWSVAAVFTVVFWGTIVSVRPDRYPFHFHGSKSSTFVIL